MNPKRFASMVVVDQERRSVLLILREDFRIWGLPGGTLEPGETPELGAIRETLEETGFETEIIQYCGMYHRPRLQDIRYSFVGRITGGQAIENGPETLAVQWFDIAGLPKKVTPFLHEIVQDALNASGEPFQKEQPVSLRLFITLQFMLSLRNLRNRIIGKA